MKLYTKPIITIDSGMAEGVYAASGAASGSGNTIPVTFSKVSSDWGNGGQAVFNLDLSGVNSSNLVVVMTFNMDIASGWGSSANANVSGKTLTLSWYSAPSSAEINVQVNNADIKNLQCTGATYSNS